MLTVDVNNIMTQLSLLEISQNTIDTIEDDTNTVLDNYNPDCFVLVYAVDDKESFGKKLLLFLFTIVMLDNILCSLFLSFEAQYIFSFLLNE